MRQQDELEDDEQHDGQLEELAPGHRGPLHREAIDVVDGLQLLADVALPLIEAESRGSQVENARRVDVTDDLQRVLRPVGQLVDVDEDGMNVAGRPRVVPAQPGLAPAASLERRVGPRQLRVEQLVVVP